MSDDVRQAAKALFDLGAANGGDPGTFDRDSAEIRAYLDRVFDKAWESSPLRAALASGERGEYERGVEDAAKVADRRAGISMVAFGKLSGWSEGNRDAALSIAKAIRSLAAPDDDAGRGE